MDFLIKINDAINGVVWGPMMLILLVGTGIYLSIRTGFPQTTRFRHMWKNTLGSLYGKNKSAGKDRSGVNVTPFQAVSTALASTVGVGNVAGVATAIVSGGVGAIFWMWVSALFGMATKYSEIVLAVKFRQVAPDGTHYGGPMYYIEKGLHMRWLAVIFSIFGGLACFGIGSGTQAAEISVAVNHLTGSSFDSSLITAVVLSMLVAFVVIGGLKRIAKITSFLVPFMALFYIIGGVVIIIMHISAVPAAFATIIREAFSFRAVGGGVFGYAILLAMRYGIARGVFSNEAGLGSAPIAHAASSTKDPVKQGLWGILEVFIDTIVICTISGLVVVIAGIYGDGLTGGALTAASFSELIGPIGGSFVRVALLLFALSTILGWSYYGDVCWGYISNNSKAVRLTFKIVFMMVVFLGAISSSSAIFSDTSGLELAWDIADTLNGLMAIPNLIGLLLLSGTTIALTKKYFATGSSLDAAELPKTKRKSTTI